MEFFIETPKSKLKFFIYQKTETENWVYLVSMNYSNVFNNQQLYINYYLNWT